MRLNTTIALTAKSCSSDEAAPNWGFFTNSYGTHLCRFAFDTVRWGFPFCRSRQNGSLAGAERIELSYTVLETAVLPLNYAPMLYYNYGRMPGGGDRIWTCGGFPLTCFRDRRLKPDSATPPCIIFAYLADNTFHLFRWFPNDNCRCKQSFHVCIV